jgi:hypothetical protein
MIKNNKTGVSENSKIGKNDNFDLGNNKNNKTKSINKDSSKSIKINSDNIDYNPNLVYVNLIKEIAKKEANIAKLKIDYKSCTNC